MTMTPTTRQLMLGSSHVHPDCAPDRLLSDIDPLVIARKGLLYLNASAEANQDQIQTLVQAYYEDTSFDVAPSLARALTLAYGDDESAQEHIPLALVVQGNELTGLGNANAGLWLAHRDEARSLLSPWRDATGGAWQVARWRLMVNDVVILGTQRLGDRLGAERIRKSALSRRPLEDTARAMSRACGSGRHDRPGIMVLRVPGFQPVAGIGNQPVTSKAADSPNLAPELRDTRRRSPIWTALLLAALLIGGTVAITKPDLSKESMVASLAWMLTPVPTETPIATPTPTQPAVLPPEYRTAEAQATELAMERSAPLGTRDARTADKPPTTAPVSNAGAQSVAGAQSAADAQSADPAVTPTPTRHEYATPRLISPGPDAHIDPTYLTLEWEWDGELAEDEYFDVRLWTMGGEKQGIAWSKQPMYIKRAVDAGWHSWTVVVIRGRDGVVQEELSSEPTPVNFRWSVRGKEDQKPTSQPLPTRDAPPVQPTRNSTGDD